MDCMLDTIGQFVTQCIEELLSPNLLNLLDKIAVNYLHILESLRGNAKFSPLLIQMGLCLAQVPEDVKSKATRKITKFIEKEIVCPQIVSAELESFSSADA